MVVSNALLMFTIATVAIVVVFPFLKMIVSWFEEWQINNES
jgi:hypothetical protein